MKKSIILLLIILTTLSFNSTAQTTTTDKYGSTLNLGVGIGGYWGYYRYAGRSLPVFHINYEIGVAKNFTLAPFISFSTYSKSYYWGDNNNNHPYKYYSYRETVIPIGLKGTYYFDDLVGAGSRWDFYVAGSVGFVIVKSSWEDGYYGDSNYYNRGGSLFLDAHIGTEYHINNRVGLFLDFSTGVSTFGLAIH